VKLNDSLGQPQIAVKQITRNSNRSSNFDSNRYKTILLVEDDDSLRELLHTFLTGSGYYVMEASNGKAALEQFRDRKVPIHLLFTDLEMPYMDGVELAHEVHTLDPAVKILFTSGNVNQSQRISGLTDPSNFMIKPYPLSDLDQKINKLFDNIKIERINNLITQN
jgi:DNA-binding response OmpR family regulator